MNFIKRAFSPLISILAIGSIILLTAHIRYSVGYGTFVFYNLILLIPFIGLLLGVILKNQNLIKASMMAGTIVVIALIGYVLLADKPLHSEIDVLYRHMNVLIPLYIIYLLGLLLPNFIK